MSWEEGGWEGRREGGTEGRRGWGLARQQQRGSCRPPARSLARGARRLPPGSGRLAAPAPGPALWRGSGSGGQTRTAGRLNPGRAAEAGRWLGGDCEDAEPRSAGGTRRPGSGKGLCSLATNFPPVRWIPAALPGSRLWKRSLARGEGECWGLEKAGES